jgi:hypothetical protein
MELTGVKYLKRLHNKLNQQVQQRESLILKLNRPD